MSFMLASRVPTLADAFGCYPLVLKSLQEAGFTSIIPLTLLPREALFEIEGIGPTSATRVGKILKQYGLGQYQICDRMSTFIEDHFGDIEHAPIGILQVDIIRSGAASRPWFAPLDLIKVLEQCHPEMTIRDLTTFTPTLVRWTVQEVETWELQIHNLDEDIRHLHGRMRNYDLDLKAEVGRPALRVVS